MYKSGGWIAALALLALSACGSDNSSNYATEGGTSSSGSSGSSSGATVSAATVKVSASPASVPVDGSAGATITAQVLDANNNAIPGATVSFSTTSGSALGNETTTTGANGTATATLTASGAAAGSNITVTAASGGMSGTATVPVVKTSETLTLLTSSPSLPSNGSAPVIIQAIVRNASNQLVSGAVVNFTASSGGITPVTTTAGAAASPVVPAGTSDANGIAQAQLTPAGDPTNRAITVTANIGGTTASVVVNVVLTTLSVSGPSSLVLNAAGNYTVALADSGGAGIAGKTVTLSSALGNTFSGTGVTVSASGASITTGGTGTAGFTLTATKAGSDTITATALGLTATETVNVSGQSFNFTSPAANAGVNINTPQAVTLTWTNNGAPVSGQTVSFSITRGTFGGAPAPGVTTTALTSPSGTATVSISSTTAGPAVITATATNGGVPVTAQLALTFNATNPTTIDLQASPTTVAKLNQSTITAIVRDVSGNLVANQTVDFQLNDVTGGSLSAGSAQTGSTGQAQVIYTAGSTQSAANGVVITGSLPNTATVTPATVDLTVGGQSVYLSLGTGEVVSENVAKTQFQLPYLVQAQDAGGNPVANATITLTVHSLPPPSPCLGSVGAPSTTPLINCTTVGAAMTGSDETAPSASEAAFWKGTYVHSGTTWVWTPLDPNGCLNEDENVDGIYNSIYDIILPPTNPPHLLPGDVASVSPASLTTDSTGSGNITIFYPEAYANWVQVELTAATTVSGTQSSTSRVFQLPVLASYLTGTPPPPGTPSPYGYLNPSCASTQ